MNANMSKDPTFETQGPMSVFLSNQTDMGGTGSFPLALSQVRPGAEMGLWIDSRRASIILGPSGHPPPPWVQGTDWKVLPADNRVPPLSFPVQSPTGVSYCPVGNAEGMWVANRGPAKVALGGQYTLDLPFGVVGTYLSIHFTITGVAGGSTVLPGFGLWNLGSNPNAWTYISPTAFDGLWSVMLRSDDFLNYATLSLGYVRFSHINGFGSLSRLVYSVAGVGSCYQPLRLSSGREHGEAAHEHTEKHSSLEIFRASGEYRLEEAPALAVR